jgi:hypothetical protein
VVAVVVVETLTEFVVMVIVVAVAIASSIQMVVVPVVAVEMDVWIDLPDFAVYVVVTAAVR